jgi:hypothetical protein
MSANESLLFEKPRLQKRWRQLVDSRSGLRLAIIGGTFWLVAALIFFRKSWLSGFDLVPGDRGDGRLITFLHEHLYLWVQGISEFRSPAFFYPAKLTLGYTDAFILDVAPYSLFRALGADPYLSMLLMQIGLSAVCFTSAAVIYVRYFKIHPMLAYFAATLVTFPNHLFFKASAGHINFFGLYYLPPIILLALWACENFPNLTRWSLLRSFAAALLFALLFSTAFYIAWLFAVTLLIAGACAAWPIYRRSSGAISGAIISSLALLLISAVAGFAAGLIPFVYIYAPALAASPPRYFETYLFLAPTIIDVINVSRWNVVWGWFVDAVVGPSGSDPERALAVSPVLTLTFFCTAYVLLRRSSVPESSGRWEQHFLISCVGVFAISWLLTLKIEGMSAFWLLFNGIPGGVAIRAGDRIQLLVGLWIVSGCALALDRWSHAASNTGSSKRMILVCSLLLVSCVEQLNRAKTVVSRTREREMIASLPPAPSKCTSFFMDFPEDDLLFQFDAISIAQAIGLPVLNGTSGLNPPNWQFSQYSSEYEASVKRWIAMHHLSGVCSYRQATKQWVIIAP